MGDNIGNLFYPGNMLPFTGGKGLPAEGREGVRIPPWPEGRGGREAVAAVLSAPMRRQGGKGTARTTLSWEEIHVITSQSVKKKYPIFFHKKYFLLPELLPKAFIIMSAR